jgi:diacylglycerol kinase (ATP)
MAVETGTPEDRREVLVVGNPFSGMRGNRRHVDDLIRVLTDRGLRPHAFWRPEERHAALSLADLAEHFRCVIVAGGDGTVRDVLSQRPSIPMAVFPLGNENLFAKEFGFDLNPIRLAHAIEKGAARPVDVGTVGSKCFSVVVSAGFDAEVVHRVAEWRVHHSGLKRINSLSYVPRALKALGAYSFPRLEIEADGERFEGYHVFILNVNRYGMGLSLAPDARADDGLLDWLLLTRPGRFNLVGYLAKLALRIDPVPKTAVRGRANRIAIHSDGQTPVQVDGDAFGFAPVELGVLPDAVKVLRMD